MEESRTRARRVRPRALRRRDPLAERDLRRLIDRASDVIFRCRTHPRHGFEFVSPAITRITGYTPEELYADPESAINLVHRDDRAIMHDLLARGAGRVPIVLRWRRKDDSVVWIEQRDVAVYDRGGTLIAIEGIAREIADPTLVAQAPVRILGDIRIDLDRGRVLVRGQPVRLTPSELRLLVLLTDHPGRIVSRGTIMEALWDSTHVGSGRTSEVYVSKLRSKIERDRRQPERIETVRGHGYRFVPSG
jgi:PAS domain S-box-containing protein